MAGSGSPRRLAWELLRAVWEEGAYANIAWPTLLGESNLAGPDRGFATELAYGSLRHWGSGVVFWSTPVGAERTPSTRRCGGFWCWESTNCSL